MAKIFPSSARPAAPWQARRADDDYGSSADPDWRGVDWLAHRHQLEIDGGTINYVDIGEGGGTPVVFVHGLGGQWQNWLENIPRAALERRVLALDLPAHGLSERPREKITISGYARVVDAFAERLGLERLALVGNSMGGFVCSEVAIQFPRRVQRLLLVSAAGISNVSAMRAPALVWGRVAAALTAVTAARHRAMARRPLTRHGALSLVARHPSRLAADLAWEGFMKGAAGNTAFYEALKATLDYDFRERLPEIEAPTLVVWGEKDAILSVEDAQEFERLIPDARKVLMEDTGHIPMAERPIAFNDLLMEFLSETGPAEEKERAEGESERV